MRILYCTDTYLPQINGVSIVTALSVAGLRDRGWEVRIIGPAYPSAGSAARPEPAGPAGIAYCGIRSLPLPIYTDVRIALPDSRAVEQVMREFRPDIVHCATEFVVGQLAMRAASRLGIPVVTSYHTNFGQYATAYGMPFIRATVERYIRAFHERAIATLTPSDVSRQHLVSLGLDRAQRWGCGVDPVRFNPRTRSHVLRESLGLGTAFTVLYVGRLAAEKQVETVIRSYASARQLLPPGTLRLVIAGTGPREADLRRLAPADTLFLGHLDRERELPALYASADAFAFASCTETLGLVVLEAMASGLPVIATPAGGVAEHLVDGVNGIAISPMDTVGMSAAIVRLARFPEQHRALQAGALRTAAALDWSDELNRLDAVYRRALGAVGQTASRPNEPLADGHPRPHIL